MLRVRRFWIGKVLLNNLSHNILIYLLWILKVQHDVKPEIMALGGSLFDEQKVRFAVEVSLEEI